MSEVNLRSYDLPVEMSYEQAHEVLTSNSTNCSHVKTVSVRPGDNVPVINGSWYDYNVEVKNNHAWIKPKFNRLRSIILTLFCVPFAVWFVQGTFADLDAVLLPLGALFLSFGIVFSVGYILGAKEQRSILPFIYTSLKGESPAHISNPGMTANIVMTIVACLIGIAAIIAHFII